MNGIGWVCDECGKTEVLAGDTFALRGNGPPPQGWYLLFKAAPDVAMESERWEFCSVECIHAQTSPDDPGQSKCSASSDLHATPHGGA